MSPTAELGTHFTPRLVTGSHVSLDWRQYCLHCAILIATDLNFLSWPAPPGT